MQTEKYNLIQDSEYIRIFKSNSLVIECKQERNWYGKVTKDIYIDKKLVIRGTQIVAFLNLIYKFKIKQNFLSKEINFIEGTNKLKIENKVYEKIDSKTFLSLSYSVNLNDLKICNCKFTSKLLNFSTTTKYEIEFPTENDSNLNTLIYICLINPEVSVDQKNTTANSGLAQLGFQANFKVGFVLGSSVFNLYIWLIKSPTGAKPQDVGRNYFQNRTL